MTQGFGRYWLDERIGVGSIAEVWRAKSFGVEGFEKTFVVKRVLPELAREPAFVEAFVREANLAVRLSHPNVVQVFDLGRVDEPEGPSYFMAMEYVAGRDLAGLGAAWRRTGGAAPLGLALYVASEIAKSLDHAHRRRDESLRPLDIVHADVSAENVLLSWDGEVKLADFCVARALWESERSRITRTPSLVRKIASASPELVRGERIGPASDVFSLGALLYEMLAGVHPFVGSTPEATLDNVADTRFRPLRDRRPDLSPELGLLVERALRREPSARHESAARLYEDLVALLYVSGARFGAEDLSELLEGERKPAAPTRDAVESLLETSRVEPLQPSPIPSVPPPSSLTVSALSGERELSLLVLRLAPRGLDTRGKEEARQTLTRYGGRLLSEGPLEIIAVFGLAPVDSLDTENAVRAGLVALRRFAPSAVLSAGIDFDRVGLGSDGNVVEDSRLTALVARSRRLATLALRRVVVAAPASKNLRGLFELEPAVGGARAAKVPFLVGELRASGSASGRFIGRKGELRRLAELLSCAARGGLEVGAVTGAHGVGKTRLLEEAARRITAGSVNIFCAIAQCPPRGRELPESGIAAMLRTLSGVRDGDPAQTIAQVRPRLRTLGLGEEETASVLAAIGAPQADPGGAGLLASAIARMMSSLAEDRIHVLAWDNAHELDEASGKILASVAERVRSSRLLWLFAARPRDDAPYRRIPAMEEIVLGDLDSGETRRLVAARLGVESVPDELVEFVRGRAGGHPMFVEELVREARESHAVDVEDGKVTRLALGGALAVPRPLRTLLADRVRRLEDGERALLVAAAILGAPVDVAVVAAMLEMPLGAVNVLADELVRKELIVREDAVTLRFRSLMLPEVVLAELLPDARIELHRSAANAYQMVLGPRTEQESGRIAQHLAEAGDRMRAAGFYATSAFYQLAGSQLDRAAIDFGRALELSDLRSQPASELASWISGLCRAVHHVRSGAKLPALVQRLSVHVHSANDIEPDLRIRMSVDLALIFGALSRYKDAQRLLTSAVDRAESWPELARAARMAEAEILIRQGEFKAALVALERAGRRMDVAGEHRRLVATAQALAGAGEHERALDALEYAATLVDESDIVRAHERAKVRGLVHGLCGDWAGCAEECAKAAEQVRSIGLLHEVAIHLHNQGDALIRLEDLPRAYAVLRASLSMAEQVGAERLINLDQMMLAYLDALNGVESGRRVLGEKLAQAEANKWTWDALSGRTLLGRLLARQGDIVAAKRELTLAHRLAEATSNQLVVNDCVELLAELGSVRPPAK